MYNKDGRFSVKSAYKVVVQLQRGDEWTENSGGNVGKNLECTDAAPEEPHPHPTWPDVAMREGRR